MSEGARPLWPERHLTGGRLVIGPGPRPVEHRVTVLDRCTDALARLDWLARCGRGWRRLGTTERTLACVLAVLLTGGLALLVPLAGVAVVRYREEQVCTEQRRRAVPPEVTLAAWDTVEARVAGAASRAWAETLREPAWHSPFLAATRAAFDGEAEVGQVVALADRIRQARAGLGVRPPGPAAEFWDRQQAALDDAARRLGQRADALIRHRDQAAALSAELQHLADLERLERSAAAVDVLTVETASGSGGRDDGLADVAEDIAAVRHAMTDLVDLMTRTRAPLALPPEPPG